MSHARMSRNSRGSIQEATDQPHRLHPQSVPSCHEEEMMESQSCTDHHSLVLSLSFSNCRFLLVYFLYLFGLSGVNNSFLSLIFLLLSSIFYIYKEESLSVCSLCIWTRCNQMRPNFPRILFSPRGRSTSTFFLKKCGPSPAKGFPTYLTNQIAAFCSNGE